MEDKRQVRSGKSEVRSQKTAEKIGKKMSIFFPVFSLFPTSYFLLLTCSFLLLSSYFLLPTCPSFAEQKKDAKKETVPTVITSESLTADNKARTALFSGSVVAKKGDMTLFADKMLVYYSESSAGGGSNIDKIDAEGHVKLVRGDRVVTAGKAVYFAGTDERIIFTESPRAAEGKNVVIGTKMTYFMKDDRSVVENSKVFIVDKESAATDKKSPGSKQSEEKKK